MNQKAIVVGLKEKQPTLLRFAAQAALKSHTNLRIVHCLDLRTAADFASVPYKEFPPESWRAAGEDVIEDARRVVEDLKATTDADYVLPVGKPFQMLREQAATASMLVVGVDAAALIRPLSGGRLTERLIAHLAIPVAVVPERTWRNELTGPVFVAIDTRTPAAGPLRFAFTEASRTSKELHVAHVIPRMETFGQSQPRQIAVSEVLAGWSEEFPDVIVKHRFFFDDAGEGCVRASEEASLLVLGRRKTQIFGHPVHTEIAQRVHCPCVVVPDEWDPADMSAPRRSNSISELHQPRVGRRLNRLRAGLLGVNAGIAGMVALTTSKALGEYVSSRSHDSHSG